MSSHSNASLTPGSPVPVDANYEATALPLINNKINAFAIFVDSHQYNKLIDVFTSDAVFDAGSKVYRGRDAIIEALGVLTNVSSQHGYTTQYTELSSSTAATATAFIFNNFYGQGAQRGQIFTVYGEYVFTLSLEDVGWRVRTLTLTTLSTTGDETIAFPKA